MVIECISDITNLKYGIQSLTLSRHIRPVRLIVAYDIHLQRKTHPNETNGCGEYCGRWGYHRYPVGMCWGLSPSATSLAAFTTAAMTPITSNNARPAHIGSMAIQLISNPRKIQIAEASYDTPTLRVWGFVGDDTNASVYRQREKLLWAYYFPLNVYPHLYIFCIKLHVCQLQFLTFVGQGIPGICSR